MHLALKYDVVHLIKREFKEKKVGHLGTLDPLATGVLPVFMGKATKLIPYINIMKKEYDFTITWGSQTTTDDSQGKILFESNYLWVANSGESTISKIDVAIAA